MAKVTFKEIEAAVKEALVEEFDKLEIKISDALVDTITALTDRIEDAVPTKDDRE